jgi:hypothetical protein
MAEAAARAAQQPRLPVEATPALAEQKMRPNRWLIAVDILASWDYNPIT